jgi:hypothetical protein
MQTLHHTPNPTSAVRYDIPKEPRISAWTLLAVVAAILVAAYVVFKFSRG